MRKGRNIALFLIAVLLIVSCRPQADLSRDFPEAETWGEAFDIFWKKMSTNYPFWSLDYGEGRDWDRVYDEYKGMFEELGLVSDEERSAEEQRANTLTAGRYLFDITKDLSDGHYALMIDDSAENNIQLVPSTYRNMKELGYDDDQIFHFFSDFDGRHAALYDRYWDHSKEDTAHIMEYSFGLPSTGSGTATASGALASEYGFGEMQYVNIAESDGVDELHLVLGKSRDGIVYFSFSAFGIYEYMADADDSGEENEVSAIVNSFISLVAEPDTTGVIIDLRGNLGGRVAEMSVLWTALMPSDVDSIRIGETRRKASENRTDYSAWTPFWIKRCTLLKKYGTFNKDVPIAVILNENSVSCAEMSTFTLMALRDDYGYDVRLFGTHSCGGTGVLHDASETLFNAGITSIPPYISLMYTPYLQTRYLDGRSYEGTGIPVDEVVPFDAEAFERGDDRRLEAALSWLSV